MDGPVGADAASLNAGFAPQVACAACGARFDANGATTSDRVACPMCGEVVVVGQIVAEKRRYRPRGRPEVHAPSRLSKTASRRRAGAAFLFLLAALIIALALTPWADELRTSLYQTAREQFHRGNLK